MINDGLGGMVRYLRAVERGDTSVVYESVCEADRLIRLDELLVLGSVIEDGMYPSYGGHGIKLHRELIDDGLELIEYMESVMGEVRESGSGSFVTFHVTNMWGVDEMEFDVIYELSEVSGYVTRLEKYVSNARLTD